jgi:rieske iron-sulfur protein
VNIETRPSRSACIKRRELLKCAGGCLGTAALFSVAGRLNAFSGEKNAVAAPQVGDVFVVYAAPQTHNPVCLKDLVIDAPPVLVRARDPVSGIVRDDNGNASLILLVRVNPKKITPELRESSVQGVLAYSAMCTHLGCLVENWDAEKKRFQCPCHKSAFDPVQGAKVVFGPAPRPLPLLPLRVEKGMLKVAGEFSSHVGAQHG